MENNNRSRGDFTWESFYTVSNERKYDLINRVRRFDGTEDLSIVDSLKEEWGSLQSDGDDPALEERFLKEVDRFVERSHKMKESIDGKKQLIEEAKALKDSEDFHKTSEAYKALQNQWRSLGYSGKVENDRLWEEFSEINDYFFNRRKEFYAEQSQLRDEAKEKKEKLIEEVEAIKDSTDWNKTSQKQRELMEAWKEAGFASREVENELWERFNAARQVFYAAQEAHFSVIREQEKKSREIKETLIEETNTLKDSFDFESVKNRFDEMMEEWKVAGHSGRRHEEKLWQKFREGRDFFYSRYAQSRNQTREERRDTISATIEDLNHRISSLEDLSQVIEAKITQLESRPDSEERDVELSATRTYLDDNAKTLQVLYGQLRAYNDEIERL